jgi:hypothetical protein
LRRNFFRPLSFETIFGFFALQCGMHALPGSHRKKSIAAVVACPPIDFISMTSFGEKTDATRVMPRITP